MSERLEYPEAYGNHPDLADAEWKSSAKSMATGACLQFARVREDSSLHVPELAEVALRDSKDADGPVLLLDKSEIEGFVTDAVNGKLDFLLASDPAPDA